MDSDISYINEGNGRVIDVDIAEEIKKSYLAYAMSVIVGRALPDVRDGLKPVHRRILYAMYQMALWHNKPYKKSARVVGEVLGKFHPHGDQAIYDSLVRMAQDFSMNLPLIDGHGNFGSIDGDSPAAMRYTEVRLSKVAELLLEDIDKDTVDFVPNFDNTLKEPVVLPSKFPNLLINGSLGIAVGMATNIPPHNLNEVVDALKFIIENRRNYENITTQDLMKFIKGPDFPTGGIIYGGDKLVEIYEKGRGTINIWSKTKIEDKKIIIEEIPFMVNKSKMIEEIAKLVREGKISQIKDIRDESNREGIRVVIDLKNNANPEKILHYLYTNTSMRYNFPIICVALDGLEPKQMSLKEMLWAYIKHRYEVVLRKSKYELYKAQERKHILDGIIIAILNIDETVNLIKRSKDREEAKYNLMNRFSIDEVQANAILDMPLARLTNLEVSKLKDDIKMLKDKIEYLKEFINDDNKIFGHISEELEHIKEKFSWKRRTKIYNTHTIYENEIKDEKEYLIIYTFKNYIKKIPLEAIKLQKRGGVGVSINIKDDSVRGIVIAKGYEKLLVFSNKGKVYSLDVSSVDMCSRQAKGRTIYNYLESFEDNERIVKILLLPKEGNLIFLSKKGIIKKTSVKYYQNIRKGGIIALGIKEGDELIDVTHCMNDSYIIITTNMGNGLRFKASLIRDMGRVAQGVKGINVMDGYANRILCVNDNDILVLLSSKGYGKRIEVKNIPVHGRGTRGVKIINLKKEDMLSYAHINKEEGVVITKKGMMIRINIKNIPIHGRISRGVRIIKLKENDEIIGMV